MSGIHPLMRSSNECRSRRSPSSWSFTAGESGPSNGKLGGNPTLSNDEEKEASLNPTDNHEVKAQKPEARSYKEREEEIIEAKPSQAVALRKTAKPKQNHGTELADDWFPEPLSRGFLTNHPVSKEIQIREFEKFRNYWHARAGPGAVKRDWNATWRNWLINNHTGFQNGKSRSTENTRGSGAKFFEDLNAELDRREQDGDAGVAGVVSDEG